MGEVPERCDIVIRHGTLVDGTGGPPRPADVAVSGDRIVAIASEWSVDRFAAADRLQPAGAVYFMMDEEDVRRVLAYPHSMIGSGREPS